MTLWKVSSAVRAPADTLVTVRDAKCAAAATTIRVHLVSRAYGRLGDEGSMKNVRNAESVCTVVQLQIVRHF